MLDVHVLCTSMTYVREVSCSSPRLVKPLHSVTNGLILLERLHKSLYFIRDSPTAYTFGHGLLNSSFEDSGSAYKVWLMC